MEVARAARSGLAIGVFVYGIDHFKQINESFRHSAGDPVVRAIGQLFGRKYANDTTRRYGGEE